MSALSDRYPSIVHAYQQAFNRAPSDDEILSQTGNGQFSPNDPRIAYSVANIVGASPTGKTSGNGLTLPGGISDDASVNQANQFARSTPWYQAMLEAWGQDPKNVHLTPQEQQTLLAAMREQGINVSDHFEVDASGNITPKSDVGKKILIGAAIGGAALTGLGIAGIGPMAGLFGGEGAAAGTAAAGAGGVEGGAGVTMGMGAALPEALSSVPALGGAAATAAPAVASAAGAGGAGSTGGGGLLSTIGKVAKPLLGGGGSGNTGIGNTLLDIGKAAGSASQAAGNNRLNQEQLALEQEKLNQSGQSDYEQQLMARAQQEQALKNALMTNTTTQIGNETTLNKMLHPRVSPFDPTGGPKYDPSVVSDVTKDVSQAQASLTSPNLYGASTWAPLPAFKPIDLSQVQQATGTEPGILEKIGDWTAGLSPFATMALRIGGGGGGNGTTTLPSGLVFGGMADDIEGGLGDGIFG